MPSDETGLEHAAGEAVVLESQAVVSVRMRAEWKGTPFR